MWNMDVAAYLVPLYRILLARADIGDARMEMGWPCQKQWG